ncbi:MAG: S-layer homology domain-containing protein [Clostridia bacterium]|nr:S-layer homology domain-containing protein [Clostridia bacterium]MDH7573795.1 S-layer homology domain-containing protein [Clostridia bacterium]
MLSVASAWPAFAGGGGGGGSGGGQSEPFAFIGAYLTTVTGNTFADIQPLTGAEIQSVMPTIRLEFNKNVTSETVWSENQACFILRESSGNQVPIIVTRIGTGSQDSPTEQKRNVFIAPQTELVPGKSYEIVISAKLRAQAGTALGADKTVNFSVAPAAAPPADGAAGQPQIEPSAPVTFTDIAGHWAQRDIEFMAEAGMAEEVAPGKFGPSDPVGRAQFAAFLNRCLGIQEVRPEQGHFKDVPASSGYYGAVETSLANRLTVGYGDGTFKPDAGITRQEVACVISRVLARAGRPIAVVGADATLARFTDASRVSSWAEEAVAAVASQGIMVGRESGRFAPQDTINRAEAMVILKRVKELLGRA